VKLLLEIVLAILLHPIAFILAVINIAGRQDLSFLEKVVWAVVCVLWGVGPILYVLVGRGRFW
jgi:hypothetical protein